jgi:N-dimethylarginine dimethylaminohydrolase
MSTRTAASFGGPGFKPRSGTHADDIARGRWGACGVASEVGRLRQVLLAQPGPELELQGTPDEYLMLERVDLDAMKRQTLALKEVYRQHGVTAHVYDPVKRPPPNWIFMRDLFFMTPEGALLARTASEQRAGEERFAASALADLGICVLGAPRGNAVFEGADALWLDRRTVLVGVGNRTNELGLEFLRRVLTEMSVDVVPVEITPAVQHLLGAVNFLDVGLCALAVDGAGPTLRRELQARNVQFIEFGGREISEGRAMNFVTLGPRKIVMPANCPQTRARLERAGVTCVEVDVSEYLRAAGGMGCATGIVEREPLP